MVGWHHQRKGHEFEQTPRNSEGSGSLTCCSPWGHKQSDATQQLNDGNTHLFIYLFGCPRPQLRHVESSSLTMDQSQAPCLGSTVLATGTPGKSPRQLKLNVLKSRTHLLSLNCSIFCRPPSVGGVQLPLPEAWSPLLTPSSSYPSPQLFKLPNPFLLNSSQTYLQSSRLFDKSLG